MYFRTYSMLGTGCAVSICSLVSVVLDEEGD